MAPRGIGAVIFVSSLIFSLTILTSVGYAAALGTNVDPSTQNADVQAAAEQLQGIEFGEGRSGSILQGPLAAVTPVVGILQTFVAVIGNTSGLLQLLYGAPPVAANLIEILLRIAMLVTIAYVIRSGTPV